MLRRLKSQVISVLDIQIPDANDYRTDAFYGADDNPTLHDVDVMTDVSMAPTAFTRYTVAPTAASRTSRQVFSFLWVSTLVDGPLHLRRTSRSKRKMERKVGSGKKGTVDEEEYLLRSVNKLVDRFNSTLGKDRLSLCISRLHICHPQGEARGLLPHLFQFTQKHREEGSQMQHEIGDFEAEVKAALDEIWAEPSEGDGLGTIEETGVGLAERMADMAKSAKDNALKRVEKGEISHTVRDWRILLYDNSQMGKDS